MLVTFYKLFIDILKYIDISYLDIFKLLQIYLDSEQSDSNPIRKFIMTEQNLI